MQRITTSTKAANLFGAGKHGFKNGDLSIGDAPTDLNADWFNGAQEELMNAIEGSGLAADPGDLTQLLQAIQRLAGGSGRVQAFARSTAPAGWLKANGQAVSRTTYAALFAAIGVTYGAGDGSTTFNLPDLRGEFVRGLDDGRAVDAGRALGSAQAGQNASHNHGVNDPGHGHGVNVNDPGHSHGVTHGGSGNGGDPFAAAGNNADGNFATTHVGTGITVGIVGSGTGITTQNSGGTEARPRNVALLYCISIY